MSRRREAHWLSDRVTEQGHAARMWRAEAIRLEQVLGYLARIAAGDDCDPAQLVGAAFALAGRDPNRPAWTEEQERQRARFRRQKLATLTEAELLALLRHGRAA